MQKLSYLIAIGSAIFFILLGVYLIKNAENMNYNPTLTRVVGFAAIVFFGGLLARRVRLFLRSRKQD